MSSAFFVLQTNPQYFSILLSFFLQNTNDTGLIFSEHMILDARR